MTTLSNASPRVTVLMPVYNGGEYLRAAIDSILVQTFRDFELLIINDGSTDQSVGIIRSFSDSRIRLVENDGNLGLISTLNNGLRLARGEYVARMDCDDLSRPRRLEKQVALLDANPAMGVCGSWVRKFGVVTDKVCRYHTDSGLLACGLIFDPVLAHPTVMLCRRIFLDQGLEYDPEYRHAEDYNLWVRAARLCEFGNIPEVLLDYRVHTSQVSQVNNPEQRANAGRVRCSLLAELGLDPSKEEFDIHQRISTSTVSGCEYLFRHSDDWLCRIWEANRDTQRYCESELSLVLAERLVTLLKKMLENRVALEFRMFRPRLLNITGIGWVGIGRFILQSIRGEAGRA
ncbi:MAG: glycosyltransferase [Desulfuromonadaceae bacterium]|nr:glycosyltransferase [Desulfuromonadaceae bacterium]MDD5107513.1 glycosyltransferase [Desulfuromonadaceae bacterium]